MRVVVGSNKSSTPRKSSQVRDPMCSLPLSRLYPALHSCSLGRIQIQLVICGNFRIFRFLYLLRDLDSTLVSSCAIWLSCARVFLRQINTDLLIGSNWWNTQLNDYFDRIILGLKFFTQICSTSFIINRNSLHLRCLAWLQKAQINLDRCFCMQITWNFSHSCVETEIY